MHSAIDSRLTMLYYILTANILHADREHKTVTQRSSVVYNSKETRTVKHQTRQANCMFLHAIMSIMSVARSDMSVIDGVLVSKK